MTSEETFKSPPEFIPGEVELKAEPPALTVKPGYMSTEFLLVTGWTLFAGVAISRGWFTQTQADGIGAFVNTNSALILSVGAALWHYFTSRGKLKSNAVNAAAAMHIQSAFSWKDLGKIGVAVAPSVLPGKAGQVAGEILGGDKLERLDERVSRVEARLGMR